MKGPRHASVIEGMTEPLMETVPYNRRIRRKLVGGGRRGDLMSNCRYPNEDERLRSPPGEVAPGWTGSASLGSPKDGGGGGGGGGSTSTRSTTANSQLPRWGRGCGVVSQ